MTEIKGYENYILYEDGQIFSKYKNKFIKPEKDTSTGYMRIRLWRNKKKTKFYIHRLIAEHFIPNDDPDTKTIVDHIDRNKENNDIDNLRWVDFKDSNLNRGLFKNNKLREKYIWESIQPSGKYYNFYYKFKIHNIHQKYYNALYYSLEDVVKIRNDFCKKNNINL